MGLATKPSEAPSVVNFEFEEIPLDEAVNAVIAGAGNYAYIKAKLLEALPHLPEGKAFAFGSPGGQEVDEDQRRGICIAVNSTLKKAKLSWRVTYSGLKKLFVCVPSSTPRTYKKEPEEGRVRQSKWDDPATEKEIMAWRDKGLSATQITAKGYEHNRVRYLCYQKHPSHTQRKVPAPKGSPSLPAIIEAASTASGIPVEALTRRQGKVGRPFRKAIQAVATRDFAIDKNEVGKAFGVTGDAVTFNLKTAFQVEKEINDIRKVLVSKRIKEGIAVAQANGVKVGRPQTVFEGTHVDKVKALRAKGMTVRAIASSVGIHRNTVGRILGGKY